MDISVAENSQKKVLVPDCKPAPIGLTLIRLPFCMSTGERENFLKKKKKKKNSKSVLNHFTVQ